MLNAPKRELVENDLRRIDPRIAGVEMLGGPVRLIQIAGPYRRSQAIDGIVGFLDGLPHLIFDLVALRGRVKRTDDDSRFETISHTKLCDLCHQLRYELVVDLVEQVQALDRQAR